METVRLQSAVNSLLECGFCLEVYEDPRILSCGHTFCLKCLLKQYETSLLSKANEITCGICRTRWIIPEQGVASLPKNFVVQSCSTVFTSLNKCSIADDDMEHAIAEYFCIDCWEPFCVSCKNVHRKTKFTKGHILKSITEINKEDVDKYKKQVALMCSQHKNQELTLFCSNCKEIGCSTCIIKSHSTHNCTDLIDADKNFTEKINIWLDVLRKREKDLQFQVNDATKLITSLYFDHAFLFISTTSFIDDIKITLRSLLENFLFQLDLYKQNSLFTMTAKMDEKNCRIKNCLAINEELLKNLKIKILQNEKYLSPSSSVNERLQFIKEQEIIPDDENKNQDSTSDCCMTYDLIDDTQWKSEIENWIQPIKTVLTTAATLPLLKTYGEKNEVSARENSRSSQYEQRKVCLSKEFAVVNNEECAVLSPEESAIFSHKECIVHISEECTISKCEDCIISAREDCTNSKCEDFTMSKFKGYAISKCQDCTVPTCKDCIVSKFPNKVCTESVCEGCAFLSCEEFALPTRVEYMIAASEENAAPTQIVNGDENAVPLRILAGEEEAVLPRVSECEEDAVFAIQKYVNY